MQVDGHIEPFGTLKDWPEAPVVDKEPVGKTVDRRPFEPKLDSPLEFLFPATVKEEQEWTRNIQAWIERVDPSLEDIAKAIDLDRIPR